MRTTFNSSINYRKSKKWTTELQYWFSSFEARTRIIHKGITSHKCRWWDGNYHSPLIINWSAMLLWARWPVGTISLLTLPVTKCNHLLTTLSSLLHIVKESDETKFILLMQLSPTYN